MDSVLTNVLINAQLQNRTTVFLHSSAAVFSKKDLSSALSLPYFNWVIPKDMCRELSALSKKGLFADTAGFLLEKTISKEIEISDKTFFEMCSPNELAKINPTENIIFLAGEKNIWYCLSKTLEKKGNVYILWFSQPIRDSIIAPHGYLWCLNSEKNSLPEISPLPLRYDSSSAKQLSSPSVYLKASKLIVKDLFSEVKYIIDPAKLEWLNAVTGNEGWIFKCKDMPNTLIKLSRDIKLTVGRSQKMIALCRKKDTAPINQDSDCAAIPTARVFMYYNGREIPIGVTIPEFPGASNKSPKNLSAFLTDDEAKRKIIPQLLELILQLHTNGILINDLALENILVCQNGDSFTVCICDADSFQVSSVDCPGGGIRPEYIHPDRIVSDTPVSETLCTQKSELFALAVLLYKLFLSTTDSPFNDKGVFRHRRTADVNEKNSKWDALDTDIKKQLKNALQSKREVSIGCWLELF